MSKTLDPEIKYASAVNTVGKLGILLNSEQPRELHIGSFDRFCHE